MAGNIGMLPDLTKVLEISVKDTSDPLRRFLLDLLVRVDVLESKVKELTARLDALP